MADDPLEQDDVTQNGRTVAERADDGDGQLEAFPMGSVEGDAKVTLRTLVKSGDATEFTASMRAAEVPLRGGLVDPRKPGRALVTYEVAKIDVVAVREDGELVGWKQRASLRPTYVEPIGATDADLIAHYFGEILAASPSEGGALADRIAAMAREALQAA
jgi:hypothetical protein